MFVFHTVTGRRVVIKKMTGVEEKALLSAATPTTGSARSRKQQAQKQSAAALRALITSLVVESDPPLDFTTMTIGEEFDLLLLVRLASLGPIYSFTVRCPNEECGARHEFNIDIRKLRRVVQTCADKACACHEIKKKYDPKSKPVPEPVDYVDPMEEHLIDGVLAANFSAIPVNHLEENPPSYMYVLPVSGYNVECELPTIDQKESLGRWAESVDPSFLSKSLALMTTSIDGVTDARDKVMKFNELSTIDRLWLRDKLQDAQPGVDTEVDYDCPSCGQTNRIDVEIDGNFFLPTRVHMTDWYVSLLVSVRETGKSIDSWTTPSPNVG